MWRERINRFLQVYPQDGGGKQQSRSESRFDRFLFQPESQDGILQAIVLAKKAELLGMTVSDKSINDYINAVTNGPLDAGGDRRGADQSGRRQNARRRSFPTHFSTPCGSNCRRRTSTTLLFHDAVDYDTPEERWDYFSRIVPRGDGAGAAGGGEGFRRQDSRSGKRGTGEVVSMKARII